MRDMPPPPAVTASAVVTTSALFTRCRMRLDVALCMGFLALVLYMYFISRAQKAFDERIAQLTAAVGNMRSEFTRKFQQLQHDVSRPKKAQSTNTTPVVIPCVAQEDEDENDPFDEDYDENVDEDDDDEDEFFGEEVRQMFLNAIEEEADEEEDEDVDEENEDPKAVVAAKEDETEDETKEECIPVVKPTDVVVTTSKQPPIEETTTGVPPTPLTPEALASMKFDQIRQLARSRGVDAKGSKDAIIARLLAA